MESSRLQVVVPLIGPIDSIHLLLASVEHSAYDRSRLEVVLAGTAADDVVTTRLLETPDLTVERRVVTQGDVAAAVRHAVNTAAEDGNVLFVTAGQVLHPSALRELTREASRGAGLVLPVTNFRRGVREHPPNGATFLDYRAPVRVVESDRPSCGLVPASARSLPDLGERTTLRELEEGVLGAWSASARSRRTCATAFAYHFGHAASDDQRHEHPEPSSQRFRRLRDLADGIQDLRGGHELAVYTTSFARRVLHVAEHRLEIDRPPIGRHAYSPRAAQATGAAKTGAPLGQGHPDRRPSVLYLLPALGRWGGVISVIQLVNRMVVRGIDANVATHSFVEPKMLREPMLFRPHLFHTRRQLIREIRPYDVVVAASWDTVFDALEIQARTGCYVVNFVQDFDPDVQAPGSRRRGLAEEALALIDDKIVKSVWLAERIHPYGGAVHHIPLGLNLDSFHPPATSPTGRPRVVVNARPKALVRNLEGAVEVLLRLQRRRPDVLATFVGRRFDVPAELSHEHLGERTQAGVADTLRTAAVLLDTSWFQGFGRPGLEAMACGVPAVLTSKGGINEYAAPGRNCLQVDPDDPDGFVEAIERVLDDAPLRASLRRSGLETAARYDAEVEADRTIELFSELVGSGGQGQARASIE